jgi:hypothetical protein
MVLAATDATAATSRYTLLETLRAYGRERLGERGEADATHRTHACYHVALVENLGRLAGPDLAGAADAITRSLDDLRPAHAWALGHDPALRCAWSPRSPVTPSTGWCPRSRSGPRGPSPRSTSPIRRCCRSCTPWQRAVRGSPATWCARPPSPSAGLAAAPGPDHPARRFPLYILGEVALFERRLDDCARVSAETERLAEGTGDHLRLALAGVNRVLARACSGYTAGAVALADQIRDRADRGGHPVAAAWARYVAGEARLETYAAGAVTLLEDALARAEALTERYL